MNSFYCSEAYLWTLHVFQSPTKALQRPTCTPRPDAANCVMLEVAERGGSAGHEANISAVSENQRDASLKAAYPSHFNGKAIVQRPSLFFQFIQTQVYERKWHQLSTTSRMRPPWLPRWSWSAQSLSFRDETSASIALRKLLWASSRSMSWLSLSFGTSHTFVGRYGHSRYAYARQELVADLPLNVTSRC
jgi:hypothetical protein